ncbi:hypothetical protein HNV23_08930 [Bacillus paranthracis]|uniref:hypothetical protein n=1 Tax=Bacillus paranthracis TaxID=2026186 RepID=UPI00148F19C7|nr:hypothetical protein [Bacillus paranthracis]NOP79608.1 hypothetical protein [Bacillus paranthracis]
MGSKALTKNQIELISTLAGQEAIKQYKALQAKQKKTEKDWRLRNTKLLLQNYKRLKGHCEEIDSQIEEFEESVFNLEDLTLESLMKYRFKTAKMMKHFDRMLKHLEDDCMNGTEEDKRRWHVIYYRYLSEKVLPVHMVAEALCVEQGTVYRDTKIAIADLSVLLFGISAIEFIH